MNRSIFIPLLCVLSFLSFSAFSTQTLITKDEALDIAINNAGVPMRDVFNIKVQSDSEGQISVFQVEFETNYGDFDYSVTKNTGLIIDADSEVDEKWIGKQTSVSDSMNGLIKEISRRVPGFEVKALHLRSEGSRWEGEFWVNSMKYEFEADKRTGIISDWNAEQRQ